MGKIGGGDGWGGASLWLLPQPRVISLQAFAQTWEPWSKSTWRMQSGGSVPLLQHYGVTT